MIRAVLLISLAVWIVSPLRSQCLNCSVAEDLADCGPLSEQNTHLAANQVATEDFVHVGEARRSERIASEDGNVKGYAILKGWVHELRWHDYVHPTHWNGCFGAAATDVGEIQHHRFIQPTDCCRDLVIYLWRGKAPCLYDDLNGGGGAMPRIRNLCAGRPAVNPIDPESQGNRVKQGGDKGLKW